jgi:hypothetical protein
VVFGQKAIAGMDRIRTGFVGDVQDTVHVQVTLRGVRLPHAECLVRIFYMQGILVGDRIDGHRIDSQFAAGPHHPYRDLPPVGDQDTVKVFH